MCALAGAIFSQDIDSNGVLVVYSLNWPDSTGNGQSDSKDLAGYYAARRGIPASHVIGVHTAAGLGVFTGDTIEYALFYDSILVKIQAKLEEYDGPVQNRDVIYYIAVVRGVPLCVNTHFDRSTHPVWPNGSYDHNIRCLDQWLVNVDPNVAAGYNAGTGQPGVGTARNDNRMLYYYKTTKNTVAPFSSFRDANRTTRNYYLVTRIDGPSLMHAQGLVDKALYAERYLKNFTSTPTHAYHSFAVLDHDDIHENHNQHLVNAKLWFDGTEPLSPFFSSAAIGPWDLIVDNYPEEIGESGHAPRVWGEIDTAGVRADSGFITLNFAAATYFYSDFFTPGRVIRTSRGNTAVVESIAPIPERLFLNTTAGFQALDTVYDAYGPLPVTNCMFYHGYYGPGAYKDVYTFIPGAVGYHMEYYGAIGFHKQDPGWCNRAIQRNITATAGAVEAPSSEGIPYGDYFLYAFTRGRDFAESCYNSVYFGNRWMFCFFGDPLYAPFRNPSFDDAVAPEFSLVATRRGLAATGRILHIALAGGNADKDAEFAQYKVEYGLTTAYGALIDFETGWGSVDGLWEDDPDARDYFFSRVCERTIQGLAASQTYHYRITARDPYGNQTVSPDMLFSTAVTADTGYNAAHTGVFGPRAQHGSECFSLLAYPQPANPGATIVFSGTGRDLAIDIYSVSGECVRKLRCRGVVSSVFWDGRDSQGRKVPSGVYCLRVAGARKAGYCRIALVR